MRSGNPTPVIDIFAGPGGLSEGFSRLLDESGANRFAVVLSIEKDSWAHRTLELRSFFRHLGSPTALSDYYRYLRGPDEPGWMDRETLFDRYPAAAKRARAEAWHQELGPRSRREVSRRIRSLVDPQADQPWVLIGGPPCQAYSIAGRSRMRPVVGCERFELDARHTLYREYLYILKHHRPHVFVMENVKGLLSSQLKSESVFKQILIDLDALSYRLFSFVRRHGASVSESWFDDDLVEYDPGEFVIEAEHYGIPQTRHRVIILGIRSDLVEREPGYAPPRLRRRPAIAAATVLSDLPRLRSGLSHGLDSPQAWRDEVNAIARARWLERVNGTCQDELVELIIETAQQVRIPQKRRGGRFVRFGQRRRRVSYKPDWFEASGLAGACNHETREHFASDLHRYLFASCFAKIYGHSPKLRHFPLGRFPVGLLPEHESAKRALRYGNFNDRFRVQVGTAPATTVMSHIAKDGHYYIHPDPSQCRSLTVREGARIQTFPDDYFFEGFRTHQYRQVGNAVPPLLAWQLARVVSRALGDLTG